LQRALHAQPQSDFAGANSLCGLSQFAPADQVRRRRGLAATEEIV